MLWLVINPRFWVNRVGPGVPDGSSAWIPGNSICEIALHPDVLRGDRHRLAAVVDHEIGHGLDPPTGDDPDNPFSEGKAKHFIIYETELGALCTFICSLPPSALAKRKFLCRDHDKSRSVANNLYLLAAGFRYGKSNIPKCECCKGLSY